MINLLIGPPGGGKSYEATVYHILPALAAGRKVITNLPLDLQRIGAIDSAYLPLVETRLKTLAVEPEKDWDKAARLYEKFGIAAKSDFFVDRAFANPEDYGDSWRHPETGAGPLYVIDECHLALPRGTTKRAVEEWFSLHRHESADVLLITQSYGKVSRSIVDLVQLCYRVKKATAFGSAKKYIRKVQDGVRGEVVNTAIRQYEKRYFGLYKSHTRGGGAELEANDVVPIWKRWPFIGAALMFSILAGILGFGPSLNIITPKVQKPQQATAQAPQAVKVADVDSSPSGPEKNASEASQAGPHPYNGKALHVLGAAKYRGAVHYLFSVSQNGQRVHDVTSADLVRLGYVVESGTDCAAKLVHGNWSTWVVCDAPALSVMPASSSS